MTDQEPNSILNRVRILEAQRKEAMAMLMDSPTAEPIHGHVFETRSRAKVLVLFKENDPSNGPGPDWYACPIDQGHGVTTYKGDAIGITYPLTDQGRYFIPQEHQDYIDQSVRQMVLGQVPEEAREVLGPLLDRLKDQFLREHKISDVDTMALHMMDLMRDLGAAPGI